VITHHFIACRNLFICYVRSVMSLLRFRDVSMFCVCVFVFASLGLLCICCTASMLFNSLWQPKFLLLLILRNIFTVYNRYATGSVISAAMCTMCDVYVLMYSRTMWRLCCICELQLFAVYHFCAQCCQSHCVTD